ncbi:uncharacterized protein LOC126373848 isoform X2 [Pectinophora gossypiella]|uniref:uncharacterized protein LOC126373848 isoform X2 n=1 Tax=Pectinophora gossypiella TaxID=13191 RepID=UPI00214EA63D|nr:uncharacterized protein LOC126373848 isoform X2 [Pectinophora gossypiella]
MASKNNNISVSNFLVLQLVFMVILFVSQSPISENTFDWVLLVARNLVYLLTARVLQEACVVAYDSFSSKRLMLSKLSEHWVAGAVLVTSSAVLLAAGRTPLGADFPQLYTAYLVCQLLIMGQQPAPTINYGRGMACSFFEGYLSLIIPSDGAKFQNFVEKIQKLEDQQGVVFPVKKLLLVVTKSLRCPPDLNEFNEPNRHDLPQIKACRGPEEVKKDVAGVKARRYRNTAYKIWWAGGARPPVYITAECATPLHTLYGVLQKRNLYEELCDVDVQQLVDDFCSQLQTVLARSPDCRGKCEFVFFDDTDPNQYLPQLLLDKVAELEPRYQEIIARHAADRADRPEPKDVE